jgi:hypothetical protein
VVNAQTLRGKAENSEKTHPRDTKDLVQSPDSPTKGATENSDKLTDDVPLPGPGDEDDDEEGVLA